MSRPTPQHYATMRPVRASSSSSPSPLAAIFSQDTNGIGNTNGNGSNGSTPLLSPTSSSLSSSSLSFSPSPVLDPLSSSATVKALNYAVAKGLQQYNQKFDKRGPASSSSPPVDIYKMLQMANRFFYRISYIINCRPPFSSPSLPDLSKEMILTLSVQLEVRQMIIDIYEQGKKENEKGQKILQNHSWIFGIALSIEEILNRLTAAQTSTMGLKSSADSAIPRLIEAPLELLEERLAYYQQPHIEKLYSEYHEIKNLRGQAEAYLSHGVDNTIVLMTLGEIVGKCFTVLILKSELRRDFQSLIAHIFSVCRANTWASLRFHHGLDILKTSTTMARSEKSSSSSNSINNGILNVNGNNNGSMGNKVRTSSAAGEGTETGEGGPPIGRMGRSGTVMVGSSAASASSPSPMSMNITVDGPPPIPSSSSSSSNSPSSVTPPIPPSITPSVARNTPPTASSSSSSSSTSSSVPHAPPPTRPSPRDEIIRIMTEGSIFTGYFLPDGAEKEDLITTQLIVFYDANVNNNAPPASSSGMGASSGGKLSLSPLQSTRQLSSSPKGKRLSIIESSATSSSSSSLPSSAPPSSSSNKKNARSGALYWSEYPHKRKSPDQCLPLKEVSDILLGCQTAALQSSPLAEQIADCCFTIVSKQGTMINLQAESQNILTEWLTKFTKLLSSSGKKMLETANDETNGETATATAPTATAPSPTPLPISTNNEANTSPPSSLPSSPTSSSNDNSSADKPVPPKRPTSVVSKARMMAQTMKIPSGGQNKMYEKISNNMFDAPTADGNAEKESVEDSKSNNVSGIAPSTVIPPPTAATPSGRLPPPLPSSTIVSSSSTPSTIIPPKQTASTLKSPPSLPTRSSSSAAPPSHFVVPPPVSNAFRSNAGSMMTSPISKNVRLQDRNSTAVNSQVPNLPNKDDDSPIFSPRTGPPSTPITQTLPPPQPSSRLPYSSPNTHHRRANSLSIKREADALSVANVNKDEVSVSTPHAALSAVSSHPLFMFGGQTPTHANANPQRKDSAKPNTPITSNANHSASATSNSNPAPFKMLITLHGATGGNSQNNSLKTSLSSSTSSTASSPSDNDTPDEESSGASSMPVSPRRSSLSGNGNYAYGSSGNGNSSSTSHHPPLPATPNQQSSSSAALDSPHLPPPLFSPSHIVSDKPPQGGPPPAGGPPPGGLKHATSSPAHSASTPSSTSSSPTPKRTVTTPHGGWQQEKNDDGFFIYVHHSKNLMQFDKPEEWDWEVVPAAGTVHVLSLAGNKGGKCAFDANCEYPKMKGKPYCKHHSKA